MDQIDLLGRLSAWFSSQCDDDWEHNHGIWLETMDDPGWRLRVSLEETELESVSFQNVSFNEDLGHRPWGVPLSEQAPWYSCEVKGNEFIAMCDPTNLGTVVGIFLEFAASNPSTD